MLSYSNSHRNNNNSVKKKCKKRTWWKNESGNCYLSAIFTLKKGRDFNEPFCCQDPTVMMNTCSLIKKKEASKYYGDSYNCRLIMKIRLYRKKGVFKQIMQNNYLYPANSLLSINNQLIRKGFIIPRSLKNTSR